MRPSRALALALLVLPLAAPGAAACSWAVPEAFTELHWDLPDRLLTQQGYRMGRYELATQRFTALADTFPRGHAAPGPGGAFVSSHGGDDPAHTTNGAMCEMPVGATVVRPPGGAPTTLLDGSARALASGGGTLAVAHAMHGLLAYTWDDWTHPRSLHAGGLDAKHVWDLAVSPDGALVAAADRGDGNDPIRVFLFRARSGQPLDPGQPSLLAGDGEPKVRLAFSPDARHLAVGVSPGDRNGRVQVFDLQAPGFPKVAERRDAEGLYGLAWGPRGLAASYTAFEADRDPVPPRSVLRLFAPGTSLTLDREATVEGGHLGQGLAWSPDGARLAAGVAGKLRIYTADLREERAATMREVVDDVGQDDAGPPIGRPVLGAPGLPPVLAVLGVAGLALVAARRRA